jgi:hypothetical protein
MKTKLLIATCNGWHTEDGFEIDLPFVPQIGMQIRLNEKNMLKWEKILYKSHQFNEYVEDYGYASKVEDVWRLTAEQCRKIFTNGYNIRNKPYFTIDDANVVHSVSFEQGEKYPDVLYVVLFNGFTKHVRESN